MRSIKDWLTNTVDDVREKDKVIDIHIDEFYKGKFSSATDLFIYSCTLFNKFCNEADEMHINDLRLELRIELKSDFNKLKGVVKCTEELIEEIDMFSMPEIVLLKPVLIPYIPAMEFYRSPLPFSINSYVNDGVRGVYEEYRTVEDLLEGECYFRWLTLVYSPYRAD